ncbi:MAG: hypothetical protein SGPRY_012473 [Prymnesium sp.]
MQAPSHSLSMVPGKVEFADVHFGYQEGHPLLKGISFSVEAGQTLALVGSSGSGKSSIMRLLCRFFDPQQGSVRIDGQVGLRCAIVLRWRPVSPWLKSDILCTQDLREVQLDSLRKCVGVVPQVYIPGSIPLI